MRAHFNRWFGGFERVSSIRGKIVLSYIILFLLLVIPNALTLYFSSNQADRYNSVITNITDASTLNTIVKNDINEAVWDVVAGKVEFKDGRQYAILNDIDNRLRTLIERTVSHENKRLLGVALRAMETLTDYVDKLGKQIELRAPVSENEQILEEIYGVSALVDDLMQQFMLAEIVEVDRFNEQQQTLALMTRRISIAVFVLAALVSVAALWIISESITRPIFALKKLAARIAEGDLEARAGLSQVVELTDLTDSLNTMAGKIQDLIDTNISEQKKLRKSMMQTLQAQITPHFLYNTLDAIIFLAESNRNDEVKSIVRALSNFFRTTLSKGQDFITVREEIEHVRSYLVIQKIRYRDILDFEIEAQEDMLDAPILKLLLQPLVENALYHGIKNRRGPGKILVRAWSSEDLLGFSVEDNGVGMGDERLSEIINKLKNSQDTVSKGGYGLYNVQMRLKLYYNLTDGLIIESEQGQGTKVSFCVPLRGKQDV